MVTGCSGPPAQTFLDITHYEMLDSDYDWVSLDESLNRGEILLIERVDGRLAVLNESSRGADRDRGVLKYAGAVIRYERGKTTSALISHRLLGLRFDRGLVDAINDAGKQMSEIADGIDGLAIVLDSVETMSDAQIASLAQAPVECLLLDGLHYISTEQAATLAGFSGSALGLNEVLWIGCPQIRELAKFKGDYLSLNGLRTLTVEQAQDLCQFTGRKLVMTQLDDTSRLLLDRYRTSETALIITSLD
jgi:hypothetical protein